MGEGELGFSTVVRSFQFKNCRSPVGHLFHEINLLLFHLISSSSARSTHFIELYSSVWVTSYFLHTASDSSYARLFLFIYHKIGKLPDEDSGNMPSTLTRNRNQSKGRDVDSGT